jgi:glycine hydroxymethyltransferase
MNGSWVGRYLSERDASRVDAGFVAYLANLEVVARVSPEVARSIVQELIDERSNIKLIASENFSSLSVQCAMANLLTDKYAEGFPFKRFYAGCDNVDAIEDFARKQACALFGAEHAYVQPHSGADANMIAFWAILSARVEAPWLSEHDVKNPMTLEHGAWEKLRQRLGNQRMLGMSLDSGGHLTHGFRHNVSAKMFDSFSYSVSRETGLLDYDQIEKQAVEIKPLVLLAGYSSYPRKINFARMRAIADKVGAVFMVDMAHFAGLVAGDVFAGDFNPIPFAHVVTSTTHKTLRGPRGGLILCTKEFADQVDRGCPLVQGGPLPHVMAAKAVCFTEALRPEFRQYAGRIVENAHALAEAFLKQGAKVVSGGTDNHLVLVDVRPFGLTGRQAESALRECGITLNRNSIPFDPNGPWYTSGLRLGTPAVTTLGMGQEEMGEIAGIITSVLSRTSPDKDDQGKPSQAKYRVEESAKSDALRRVRTLLERYPLYPELDGAFLQSCVGL